MLKIHPQTSFTVIFVQSFSPSSFLPFDILLIFVFCGNLSFKCYQSIPLKTGLEAKLMLMCINYFLTKSFFTEFIEKLHSTYQALISGTYRPGQIVIVPTLSRPTQHKTQQPAHTATDAAQVSPEDGVEVHSFLEAILQIIHTSNGSFRYTLF